MPEVGDLTKEGAAEGRFDNWGEVVTRQPYRKVRLDHLLSKEMEEVGVGLLLICQRGKSKEDGGECAKRITSQDIFTNKISGGYALGGHTRSHPEHDG